MDRIKLAESVQLLQSKLDQISEITPESIDDLHKLFVYFIGEQFEGIPPIELVVCDRKGDQKIDFYVRAEDRFAYYQCKIPELSTLQSKKNVYSFGPDIINEAEDILTFLNDENGSATGNECAQEARTRFRSNSQMAKENQTPFRLEIALAIFGRLTPSAKEKLKELQAKWESESIRITLRDYDAVVDELILSSHVTRTRPKYINLNFQTKSQAHTNQWCQALVPVRDFVELFDKHKMSLFDANVRYYLERSQVNKKIVASLMSMKGQKNFHLLNNGICITCSGWKLPKLPNEPNIMKLDNPQIINGCQTVISIHKAYGAIKKESTRRDFEQKCYVQVRVIKTQDPELISNVVIATNDQNKMEPRNLLSNTLIQRRLQNHFDLLKPKWFYQRKDGEFESYKQFGTRGFRPRDYEYSSKKYRLVDNEILAKAWLSFIGLSKDASERINAFESINEGGRYEWIFERTPKDSHWQSITRGPQVEFVDDNFENYPPAAEQYLLAHIINEFIRAYIPSPFTNRRNCEARLRETGTIDNQSTTEQINAALMEDEEYVINQVLSNMKEVILEFYSWTLINKYGPLNGDKCHALLKLYPFNKLIISPELKGFVKDIMENEEKQVPNNILFSIFEFNKDAITRWYSKNRDEYRSSPRRIRYMHDKNTINRLKVALKETHEQTKRFAYKWKDPDKQFLDCLPELI